MSVGWLAGTEEADASSKKVQYCRAYSKSTKGHTGQLGDSFCSYVLHFIICWAFSVNRGTFKTLNNEDNYVRDDIVLNHKNLCPASKNSIILYPSSRILL